MIQRLTLLITLTVSLMLTSSLAAQDAPPKNILNLPAFGFLTLPTDWIPLRDHPYAPAAQSADGTITLRLQSGDTLESPLTVDAIGKNPSDVLASLNLDLLRAPRAIRFTNEDGNIVLEGMVVETKLDDPTNRLLVIVLPPQQDNWYLITLDAPAKDWKAVLPLADSLLKTFQPIPNAPLLRVVLGYALPEGAVLRRQELAALEIISQRLEALDLKTEFTLHLLPDQTLEIGFYGAVKQLDDLVAWVRQVGFVELVDVSGVETPVTLLNTPIMTTGYLAWQAANQPAMSPIPAATQEDALLDPTTKAPFETILTGDQFSGAEAKESSATAQWGLLVTISQAAQDTVETFTAAHLGGVMALVLDGRVLIAPRIQGALRDSFVLSGAFSQEEMVRLAALVKSGPLPVALVVKSVELLE